MERPSHSEPGLVSVVVTFLDAQRFLAEALDSVLAQSYRNWELLLVDDGSCDGSAGLALRYVSAHPERVRYLQHDAGVNRGISASRNLGIAHARGEYIAFLDADDCWSAHKLARQVHLMTANPSVGLVYGRSKYWRSWTGQSMDANPDYIPPLSEPANAVIPPPQLLVSTYPLGSGVSPCPSDLMLRADTVRQVGGFEESFAGDAALYEDQAFLSKIYLVAHAFAADECWTSYRLHEDSLVARVRRSGRYHDVRREYLRWLPEYLHGEGVDHPMITNAVRRACWPYRHPRLHRMLEMARATRERGFRLARRAVGGMFQDVHARRESRSQM